MRAIRVLPILGALAGGCGGPLVEDLYGTGSEEGRGNGAPKGGHYNLNLIGVPQDKDAEMTGNQGHRIFVSLNGTNRINLGQGPFEVLDANATDGPGAFQLPAPDADGDGITTYSVWARALGKPGGSASATTCATDTISGELYCSVMSAVLIRSKGGSKFTNVSQELLYVYADVDGDGDLDRFGLFDGGLQEYYWQYDNMGLKLAQLRFYPLPTDVN